MSVINLMKFFIDHPEVTEDKLLIECCDEFKEQDLHLLEKAKFITRNNNMIILNSIAVPMIQQMIISYERLIYMKSKGCHL